MKTIIVRDLMTIVLGVQGENEATQVRWPGIVPKYEATFGDGAFTLVVMRPKDTSTYPVAVSIDGDDLVWVVSGADTAQAGSGKCELTYTVSDVIAKSQTWATRVSSSISGDAPGEPPEDPAKAWFTAIQAQIGNLDKLTTKAKENLVAAINEAAKTGSGGAGSISMQVSGGYIQYSTNGGTTWENLIAVAELKGDPGEDGAGMDVTGATPGQIAKITAVDDNGKPTAWEPVDLPSGGGGEEWEKIADVPFSAETSIYDVADFATWRKVKIMMSRPAYVSGLSKNVWFKIAPAGSANSADVYTCAYVTSEYGYARLEVETEINDLFMTSHKIASNNINSVVNVVSSGSQLLGDLSHDDLVMRIRFTDTSVIQSGDTATVWGVRR